MTRETIAHVPPSSPSKLSEEEAVTLRRVAFGQSDVRSLRPADLARLGVYASGALTDRDVPVGWLRINLA